MNEEKHFTSADLIKDIVIGISDGSHVPFVLVVGAAYLIARRNSQIPAGNSMI